MQNRQNSALNATDPAPGRTRSAAPRAAAHARYDETLRRTAPSRQKAAKAFLEGRSPGVMQSYAPNARAARTAGSRTMRRSAA